MTKSVPLYGLCHKEKRMLHDRSEGELHSLTVHDELDLDDLCPLLCELLELVEHLLQTLELPHLVGMELVIPSSVHHEVLEDPHLSQEVFHFRTLDQLHQLTGDDLGVLVDCIHFLCEPNREVVTTVDDVGDTLRVDPHTHSPS